MYQFMGKAAVRPKVKLGMGSNSETKPKITSIKLKEARLRFLRNIDFSSSGNVSRGFAELLPQK